MTVTVYSKPDCPQCDSTRRDLEILGIEYALVDLMQDRDALARLVAQGEVAMAPGDGEAGETAHEASEDVGGDDDEPDDDRDDEEDDAEPET